MDPFIMAHSDYTGRNAGSNASQSLIYASSKPGLARQKRRLLYYSVRTPLPSPIQMSISSESEERGEILNSATYGDGRRGPLNRATLRNCIWVSSIPADDDIIIITLPVVDDFSVFPDVAEDLPGQVPPPPPASGLGRRGRALPLGGGLRGRCRGRGRLPPVEQPQG